jgi:hypothetical protein
MAAPRRTLALAAFLLMPVLSHAKGPDIPIIVDGVALDAKAVVIREDVYIPAWILENYAHTKINWIRKGNLLEILTEPAGGGRPVEGGKVRVRVGFYLDKEGFVRGKDARVYLLNVDPKEFRFADGKGPAERAHESALERIGACSPPMREYLALTPGDRFTPAGWNIVSRLSKEEIQGLTAAVDRYESLYRTHYYDLLTTLVADRFQASSNSLVVDESMKGIRILPLSLSDEGAAETKVENGLWFLFGRMLYGNRQIVWDVPVAVRGGESSVELSNRNSAVMY